MVLTAAKLQRGLLGTCCPVRVAKEQASFPHAEGRGQEAELGPPLLHTAQQLRHRGRGPQGSGLALLQPISCLKRAKPANCPRPRAARSWEGTAAWQGQGTAPLTPPAPAPASPQFLPAAPWGAAHNDTGQRKGWDREETWESRRRLLKIDQIRARDRAGSPAEQPSSQELPRPPRSATSPGWAAPHAAPSTPSCPAGRAGALLVGCSQPWVSDGTTPGLGFGTQLPAGSGAEAGDGSRPCPSRCR